MSACGCRADLGVLDASFSPAIIHCPLHAAAERLAGALEEVAASDELVEQIAHDILMNDAKRSRELGQARLRRALSSNAARGLLTEIAKATEPEGRSTLMLPFASPSDGSGTEETR